VHPRNGVEVGVEKPGADPAATVGEGGEAVVPELEEADLARDGVGGGGAAHLGVAAGAEGEEDRLGEEPGGDGVVEVADEGGGESDDKEGEEPWRELEAQPVEDLVWRREVDGDQGEAGGLEDGSKCAGRFTQSIVEPMEWILLLRRGNCCSSSQNCFCVNRRVLRVLRHSQSVPRSVLTVRRVSIP
jgi:hypothetical protein